ncbi:hypothetical protein SAMN05444007_102136 [Cribrihabitans marinus]|uniref:DUF4886 domain-containing protein n=1 Tax=Cribrihabitans marinus TaxID=1227549 RepID=A0A1H6SZD4_9RHOB|nr:hypothetical protein [Cribrihabitans marinus]GGH23166.1 hypothetical protein GCM10010973_08890 [Cribrihabitans marinus]SEI68912.1 hypothetical protein SAMN05444007_102136 [Cribrihabitans marinus]
MRTAVLILLGLAVLAAALWWFWLRPRPPAPEAVAAAYADPLPAPDSALSVYHLGHSLVGRDMPAMLAQLAGQGHRYDSQLGWGTSLKQHWQGGDAINGLEEENAHDRFRPAKQAISSGEYDAVVLTEMVELRDAIRYHDSARYLARWADLARQAGPDVQVYLYETWHHLDDPDGWLSRLDADLPALWEDKLLLPDLAAVPDRPMRVIPAGQVMAAFARAVEARGGVGGIAGPEDLFSRRDDGTQDTIHLNALGHYLVALTHYAVLYRTSPVGLPYELRRADGSPAPAPSAEAAALMQQVVWDVVTNYPKTGVAR